MNKNIDKLILKFTFYELTLLASQALILQTSKTVKLYFKLKTNSLKFERGEFYHE